MLLAISAVALGLVIFGALWFFSAAERAHDDARALWESKEPTAYSFDYSYCSGMCFGCRLRVTVKNGEVIAAVGRDGSGPPFDCPGAPTIEDIFAMEKDDRSAGTTDSFEIDYDPSWGFPAYVDIRCPDGWFDCGTTYEVTNFRAHP